MRLLGGHYTKARVISWKSIRLVMEAAKKDLALAYDGLCGGVANLSSCAN
jgi:hypothetical protein